jgi:hypothetical protein
MPALINKKRLTPDEKSDKEVLTKALERYEICSKVCQDIYKDAIEDIKFSAGEQWDRNTTQDRRDRPCLVENRLNGQIHQVCNDQRQHRPMFRVSPRDEQTDPNTAEVIGGLLRYIQYSSDSETAFDTANNNQVRGGIGWIRVGTRYVDEESFEQEIYIDRIIDIRSVKAPIHLSTQIDFRDIEYCFIESEMDKDDFKRQFPDADEEDFKSDADKGWATEDKIRICEYFTINKKHYQIYLLSDGSIVRDKPDETTGLSVIDERTAYERKIKWYKLSASQILEKNEFPGKWIPIVPMVGDEICFEGNKRQFQSLTKNAKDPQRMLNYWRSAEAERIALAPKAKFLMYEGQDEGYEQEWRDAHKSNNPILHAKVLSEGGTVLPLPKREEPAQMDMAIVNASREAIDAIKACTGIFDASLGNEGNEKSGKAINARQRESDTGNFHFSDNAAKCLKHVGRIIVDLIPEVIDNERALRILGEDMKEELVKVNTEYSADGKIYDLTAGNYDVIVETGPSYMSKRQETADNIAMLGQKDPVLIASLRDLLLKFMDMPAEVVERARKTIDPNLLEDDENKENPQALKQQLVQANQMIQQLDGVIQEMSKESEGYQAQLAGKEMDNKTRLAIADLQAKVNILVAQIRAGTEQNKMAHEVGIESMRHSHSLESGEIEANHQKEMQKIKPPSPAANAEKGK